MGTGPDENLTYEFGAFRLDPVERLLLRDGQVVPLTPKAFDLLVYLVERHGHLVEKQALMTALWPDSIVEEVNLAFQISALRKVLDDGGTGESLIQTVPTKGYRFVAPVSTLPLTSDAESGAVGTAGLSTVEWQGVGWQGIAVGALLLAALVAVIATIGSSRRHADTPAPFAEPVLKRLTANPGDLPVTSAYVSPDGRYLAYTDSIGLHAQLLDTGETELLPNTSGMTMYAWTGDSTRVRTSACDDRTCVGWDIALVGGAHRRSGASWPVNEDVKAVPDGSRLLRRKDFRELSVDLLNGMPPRLLLRSAEVIGGQSWSADGNRILYV